MSAVNTLSSNELMEMEDRYGAHNYHPIPVVIAKGEGVHVWDVICYCEISMPSHVIHTAACHRCYL